MNNSRDIKTLFSDDELMIRWLPGSSKRLVLAFSGVQHGFGGLPMDEFVGTASAGAKSHVLFISDMLRSWFSRSGLVDRLEVMVREFCSQHDIKEVSAIGNSMGGYAAILFSGRMRMSSVAAFGPQISMHSEVILERRWTNYRSNFGPELKRSLVETIIASEAKIFIVYGALDSGDAAQAALLPSAKNLFVHMLPGCGHSVVKDLKEQGLSVPLARAMLEANVESVASQLEQFKTPVRKPSFLDRLRLNLGTIKHNIMSSF